MAKKIITIIEDKGNEVIIDLSEIKRMGGSGLTQEQMSYILGIRPETLTRQKEKYPEISQAIEEGKALDFQAKIEAIDRIIKSGDSDSTKLQALKYWMSIIHKKYEKSALEVEEKNTLSDEMTKQIKDVGVIAFFENIKKAKNEAV